MKHISVVNPEKARQILIDNDWTDSERFFIKAKQGISETVIVNSEFSIHFTSADILNVGLGSIHSVPLEEYGDNITMEFREEAGLGVLLLLNDAPYLLRVYKKSDEDYIGIIGEKFPGLRIIDFGSGENEHIENLKGIAPCKDLHTLNLDKCASLQDLSLLPSFNKLRILWLDEFNDSTQLHFISRCVKLEVLSHSFGRLSTLDHLSSLVNLKVLIVSRNTDLTDIKALSGLKSLIKLDLASCENLTDLGPLSGLEKMKELDLSDCEILNDISPVGELKSLTYLNLTNCGKLTSIRPISGLRSLKTLQIATSGLKAATEHMEFFENLTDLGPLSEMKELTILSLEGFKILSSIKPLSDLHKLTELYLSRCENIESLNPISEMKELTILSLRGCKMLSSIKPLSDLHKLTELDLSHCENIESLNPISELNALTTLNLNGCGKIKDLTPVSGLNSLTSLDLSNCGSLSDLSPISGLRSLKDLSLVACGKITRVQPICGLPELTKLSLYFSSNVRDFERLGSIPKLKELSWNDSVACSEALMASAYMRKDVQFINTNAAKWISELELSKDAASFTSRLLSCIGIVDQKERKYVLMKTCDAMRKRGMQSESINDLDVYTWESWCNLVSDLDAEDAMECLQSAVERIDVRRETESVLGPVVVAASDLTQKHPGQRAHLLDWVRGLLKLLDDHPTEQRKIAPSAAVFFASLNMREDVLSWLRKATDEKKPLWRDKVLLALVRHHGGREEFAEARRLIDTIDLQEMRDLAVSSLARAMADSHPVDAGRLLDEIRDTTVSKETARALLRQSSILQEPHGIYQLLLHLQSNPDELATTLETMISIDSEGKVAAALRHLFLKPQSSGPSASALLELCKHPSIADFVKPRALERYITHLRERAAKELADSVPMLMEEMRREGMIDEEETRELSKMMQNQ